MIPEKIAIPPKIGMLPWCDALSPATSESLNLCAKEITFGIARYVIVNDVSNANKMLLSILNTFLLFYVKLKNIIKQLVIQ